ncbi:MAG: bifunctional phosphopantothenoylcysteine decarboxylase/phosphopantothenate--cysteine ligase CoaBC [Thermodesulfobacteriota bacterium]
MSVVKNKKIILGVTGGIAAYKSCELVRSLVREEASVQVIMTQNAMEFVTPLTLQTLSGNRVATKTFDLGWESEIGHISLADSADIIVVAPATASFIGKIASGIADTLLTNVILATLSPVILCPAMNVNMYSNRVVQENLEKLRERGFIIVEPAEGSLACGWEGKGRLPEISDIVNEIEKTLTPKDLSGERVLVTAGATREFIDSVRFISNPSSGKMGYALAKEGLMRGADVVLVSGKTNIAPPSGAKVVEVVSAGDMYESVMEYLDWSTIVIKAAAVGDYTPSERTNGKIKKDENARVLKLKNTKDILKAVGERKNGRFVVGFAAETDDLIDHAKDKLKRKNADLFIANDVSVPGAGFETDTNIVHFVYRDGKTEAMPKAAKPEIARMIFDKIIELKSSSARL